MNSALKKYWWLIALAMAVLIFKVFPDKLSFLEKVDTARPGGSSNLPGQQSSNNIPAVTLSNSDFPPWVAEQLSALKESVTLTQWKKDHPDEKIVMFGTSGHAGILLNDTWYARTELSVGLPGGKTAVRHAVFYPPVAPATFELPKESEIARDHIENNCTLGIVWIKLFEHDEAQGKALALQVRNAIDQLFGKGQADIPLKRAITKSLRHTARWQLGKTVFISAYDTFTTDKNFFALGFLPSSGFYDDGRYYYKTDYEINRQENVHRIREAVMKTSVSRQDGDVLLSYYPEDGSTPTLQPDQAETLISLFERWVAASGKLDNTRKAGALIVADQVLDHMHFQLGTSSIEKGGPYRQRLEKLGAKFFKSELEASYIYDHSWLETARAIDATGPMGDLAFRLLMEMGCSKYGKFNFLDVIDQGEKYLKNDHDVISRAEIELMVAEAYRDLVALSLGAGEGNENPGDYRDKAIDARQKAIMHYRNSLPILKSSMVTNEAWREAWRLIAGLPPTHLRYYCVYD